MSMFGKSSYGDATYWLGIATVTDREGHQETVNATNENVQIRVSSNPVPCICHSYSSDVR
jgi:hypothetical protein